MFVEKNRRKNFGESAKGCNFALANGNHPLPDAKKMAG
jgi:hypothetical protein